MSRDGRLLLYRVPISRIWTVLCDRGGFGRRAFRGAISRKWYGLMAVWAENCRGNVQVLELPRHMNRQSHTASVGAVEWSKHHER